MTNEQAIIHFKEQLEVFGGEHHEAMKVAIEALDLIQRQQKKIDELKDREAVFSFDRIQRNIAELNLILEGYNVAELKKRFRECFEEQMELGIEDCINWADWLDSIASEMWKEVKCNDR